MTTHSLRAAIALGLLVLLTGCDDGARYDQAVCVLIDESGTYADERAEVVQILKREVLPALEPGDTLLVIRIDGESYEKDNVAALVTLDPREPTPRSWRWPRASTGWRSASRAPRIRTSPGP